MNVTSPGSLFSRPRRSELRTADRLVPLVHGGVAAISLIVFFVSAVRGEYTADSVVGIAFGIAAATALAAVMLYSIRRALPAVRSLGRTRTYLQIHIQSGLLFLLLMFVHSGFRYPAGTLMLVLWWLSVWVVVSGLIGLALQRSIPKLLDASSSFEVNLQRIPELVEDVRNRARTAAMRAGPSARAYFERELLPDMSAPRAALSSLLGRARIEHYRSEEFQVLRRTLPADAAPMLDELFRLHNTKLEMDLHYTLQRILRLWLGVHLPAAIVLIGIVGLHVFFVLYF